ncbi:hypothetical protein PsorP6_002225 [Peronosclerospora sorghi]|uniref:Uncharacterized protein n=1 Tax=Peronosclerospora sorghi TaxID=230839 RepID=A0ACC0WW55_9STRA|nr:hypothetical protein PsorP6_002225 [Peronosclerospora sorghi]
MVGGRIWLWRIFLSQDVHAMVMQSVLTSTPSRVLHTTIAHVSKPTASSAHTYTQFIVRVSDERSPGLNWTVYRRYSEFRNLKLALEEAIKHESMCRHCNIMSKHTCFVLFPSRRLFGNLREKTLEARRIGLNAFLDAVTKHARTCREITTCQTRPLMDKFLMVHDMRYTYLNVDMEADVERNNGALREKSKEISGLARRSSSLVNQIDPLSVCLDYRDDIVRSCPEEWTFACDELAADPKVDQPQAEEASALNVYRQQEGSQQHDTSRLSVNHNTVPNLLSYTNGRRSRTHSWNESTVPVTSSQRFMSERDQSAYKLKASSSTSRHSDPGLARNELLNFTRGSFSGGGQAQRPEGRPRSRKLHLSSAAKRVKKLEEAEARFSIQAQTRKPKSLPRLAPISEEN